MEICFGGHGALATTATGGARSRAVASFAECTRVSVDVAIGSAGWAWSVVMGVAESVARLAAIAAACACIDDVLRTLQKNMEEGNENC